MLWASSHSSEAAMKALQFASCSKTVYATGLLA